MRRSYQEQLTKNKDDMEIYTNVIKQFDVNELDGKTMQVIVIPAVLSQHEYENQVYLRDPKTGVNYLVAGNRERLDEAKEVEGHKTQGMREALTSIKRLTKELQLDKEDTETIDFVLENFENEVKELEVGAR